MGRGLGPACARRFRAWHKRLARGSAPTVRRLQRAAAFVADLRALYESTAMSLISLIITIVVVGLILWVINSFIPMESRVKSILNVVVIMCLVLWLLQAFGIIGSLRNVRVGAADGAARSMQSDLACNDTSPSWQSLPSS